MVDELEKGVDEMSQDPQSAGSPRDVRLSTGQGILYKAFKRPYGSPGNAPVLNLLASCSYPTGQWEIFFIPVYGDANKYQLMERVPGIVNQLLTYYVASYTSSFGLLELGDEVTIVDAHGEHTVKVEAMA
jgi:hypothetical protein